LSKDDLLDGHELSDLMDLWTVVSLEIWNDGLRLVEPTARREYWMFLKRSHYSASRKATKFSLLCF